MEAPTGIGKTEVALFAAHRWTQQTAGSIRGELSRWMLEPMPSVFVGKVSAMVREKLWEKCCSSSKIGGVVQIWSTNNEQGYSMRVFGETSRSVVDIEGLKLIKTP